MEGRVLVVWIHLALALVYLLAATGVAFTAPYSHWPVFVSWPDGSSGNPYFSIQDRIGEWNLGATATVLALLAALYQGRWYGTDRYFLVSGLVGMIVQAQLMILGGCGDLMAWSSQAGLVAAEWLTRYHTDYDNLPAIQRQWWTWGVIAMLWRWATTWPYYFRAWSLYPSELPEYVWASWLVALVWDLSLTLLGWSRFGKPGWHWYWWIKWRPNAAQRQWLQAAHLSLLVQSQAMLTVIGAWSRS
jgi:hypothetical protein